MFKFFNIKTLRDFFVKEKKSDFFVFSFIISTNYIGIPNENSKFFEMFNRKEKEKRVKDSLYEIDRLSFSYLKESGFISIEIETGGYVKTYTSKCYFYTKPDCQYTLVLSGSHSFDVIKLDITERVIFDKIEIKTAE